ncbi:MAG: RNA polymerase sigma factor [Planctomycetes bacterium]|nr:RNA polymerase sigma factor [Planctomycetota bacterium]
MTRDAGELTAKRARFDLEPWRAEIVAFVARMGAARDADDVVQETFLRALERPPATHPRAWLYRIALNVVRLRRRTDRRHDAAASHVARPEADSLLGPAETSEQRDLADRALSVVEHLPDGPRAALLLRLQRHMDYDEIAVALECSVATARQHFYLGLRAVRDALAENGDD